MSLKDSETNCLVSSTNDNEREEAELNNITDDVLENQKKETIWFVGKKNTPRDAHWGTSPLACV